MLAAADSLKRVHLELGGKAPLIVLEDADLDEAVKAAAFGAFMNQGQICMSTERIVVDERVADQFVERFATKAKSLSVGDPREGKAVLVLRGAGARVDGLVFQNLRVPDGNGSGIRLERSDLEVSNTLFRNSEEGILTHDDAAATLTIDRSTFSRLGRCDRGLSCAHSIYTGIYGRVIVTRSRFEKGSGGHYFKSRAIAVDVRDNSFDDSLGRGTNYMIDLPSGSVGRIASNMFVQGRDKENYSALIAVAAEERKNPSAGLSIAGNRATVPADMGRRSVFIVDWSGETLAIGPNELGPGLVRYERR
ncbi:MAG: aldehyde dehydrogenase family protein [Sphingopyxis sp.]|nr:aldehyde dehydrogenase family protein [Sphingopyxis sp.]